MVKFKVKIFMAHVKEYLICLLLLGGLRGFPGRKLSMCLVLPINILVQSLDLPLRPL